MKLSISICMGLLILGANVIATPFETLGFGSFGEVTIYKPSKIPESLVLFVSGDGGWNKGVIDMANILVAQGAMVVGIDIDIYYKNLKLLKTKCYYPAGDFEELSFLIQKKYKFEKYLKPLLAGYSSGATLVYGILVQAPANTFKGAVSLGFCPDIEIDRPLCKGTDLTYHVLKEGKAYYLEAAKQLSAPFIVLQGMTDQVCNYEDTRKYMENLPEGELIKLPKVGHGFSVTKNWQPQYISAYQKILKAPGYVEKNKMQSSIPTSARQDSLKSEMPLTIIPSLSSTDLPLAFFISGDGGWTSFDQNVCEKLAEKGMPVIGLDAQTYFWNEKQPKETAAEIEKVVGYYMNKWNKKSFVLIGYSFGACVAPFIANNFSGSLKDNLKRVYSISPDETGEFEIHIADMLFLKTNEKYNVVEELKKIESLNPICIFGDDEELELRNKFSIKGIKVETLPGNHHYNDDYSALSLKILKEFSNNK